MSQSKGHWLVAYLDENGDPAHDTNVSENTREGALKLAGKKMTEGYDSVRILYWEPFYE